MLNQCSFIGHLGRDPETRYTQGGTTMTTFSIACTEKWKDKQSGERKEKTEWINCTAFNRTAEVCGEYLSKGSKVYIQGKMTTNRVEKDGDVRYYTSIMVNNMVMLGGKGEAGGGSPMGSDGAGPGPTDEDFDDDIPF